MDLHVELPGLHLKNPIIPTSGCLGFGRESAELYNLSLLGGMAIKSATPHSHFGNPTPRVAETPCGMLGTIGLQSPGVDVIMERELSWLTRFDTEIIANAADVNEEGYAGMITKLNKSEVVKAYELNINCPNVKHGGIGLGTDPKPAANVTRMAEEAAEKPVYVKLSPNVTNIVEIAEAVEEVGTDGLMFINTLMGVRMDLHTGKPLLANVTGGLSGPAIKPVAVRMIHQVASAVNIPVIGVGSITHAEDILELLYTGASAVEVGMQNFIDPLCCIKIIEDLPKVLKKYRNNSLNGTAGRSFR